MCVLFMPHYHAHASPVSQSLYSDRTTHVVAAARGTEKTLWAAQHGRPVVTPAWCVQLTNWRTCMDRGCLDGGALGCAFADMPMLHACAGSSAAAHFGERPTRSGLRHHMPELEGEPFASKQQQRWDLAEGRCCCAAGEGLEVAYGSQLGQIVCCQIVCFGPCFQLFPCVPLHALALRMGVARHSNAYKLGSEHIFFSAHLPWDEQPLSGRRMLNKLSRRAF